LKQVGLWLGEDCVKHLGATTISITHDMASARKIADDIAMIHKGEIIWQGPARTSTKATTPTSTNSSTGAAQGPSRWKC
jgi:phospholipid/cholesterol/gamma-HCH transport system ATP-binding protein